MAKRKVAPGISPNQAMAEMMAAQWSNERLMQARPGDVVAAYGVDDLVAESILRRERKKRGL